MAHQIEENDGLAWVEKAPWHGLGTRLPKPVPSEEMLIMAGLDWPVEKHPVEAVLGSGIRLPVEGQFATVKMAGKGAPYALAVVGDDYSPIQNKDAFSFMDGLSMEGKVKYDVAGSLYNGRRVWVLARTGEFVIPGTDDRNLQYLLLVNDHTGAMSLRCFFTSIRVVCANTMNAALTSAEKGKGKGREGVSVRHSGDVQSRMVEAQRILIRSEAVFAQYREFAERLAKKQISSAELVEFTEALVPDPEERRSTRAQNIRSNIIQLFDAGMGNTERGVKGTAWAAFNGVTEFVDHVRTNKGGAQENQDKRFVSSLWGSGETMKQTAADLLIKLAA